MNSCRTAVRLMEREYGGSIFMQIGLGLMDIQRQTVVSQFFQLDRLVVEGGKSVCFPRRKHTKRED